MYETVTPYSCILLDVPWYTATEIIAVDVQKLATMVLLQTSWRFVECPFRSEVLLAAHRHASKQVTVKTRCLRHDAKKGAQLKRMELWKPPHTSLSHTLTSYQDSACSFSLRHDRHDVKTWHVSRHDVMSSSRYVIRSRHVLLRCAESSLNHERRKTASFVSYLDHLDFCLDAVCVIGLYRCGL
jgi:hypothetical protein